MKRENGRQIADVQFELNCNARRKTQFRSGVASCARPTSSAPTTLSSPSWSGLQRYDKISSLSWPASASVNLCILLVFSTVRQGPSLCLPTRAYSASIPPLLFFSLTPFCLTLYIFPWLCLSLCLSLSPCRSPVHRLRRLHSLKTETDTWQGQKSTENAVREREREREEKPRSAFAFFTSFWPVSHSVSSSDFTTSPTRSRKDTVQIPSTIPLRT